MYRHLIRQCNHPQAAPAKCFYMTPESHTLPIGLLFTAQRTLNYVDAHLLRQVWPIFKHFVFKVICESVCPHGIIMP